MRIHRLEIQAFGPFAQRQVIDFDALSEHGLFLLNGATGAGKTSVLDAICYALYGSVPGVRQMGKRLRSDHAPVELAPEIVCEFSAGTRRLEVTRSPQWDRPAKRGAGTTTEPARTLLRELINGEWAARSNRNDEAGLELQNLLGMNRDQFTRVVMLPQGEFAAFLRSDAKSRRELLQQLFSTDRFETVELLLSQKAAAAAAKLSDAGTALEQLLHRAEDEVLRYGRADPAEGADDAPESTGEADVATLRERLAGMLEAGRLQAAGLAELRDGAQESRVSLEMEREGRLALTQLRAAVAANQTDLETAGQLRTTIERHQGARILAAGLRVLEDAQRTADQWRRRSQTALIALTADPSAASYLPARKDAQEHAQPDHWPVAELNACATTVSSDLAVARAALPEEESVDALARTIEGLRLSTDSLRSATTAAAAEILDTADQLKQSRLRIEPLERSARRVETLRSRRDDCRNQLGAIERYLVTSERVEAMETDHAQALMRFLELKEKWLNALKRRLDQAAEELAARLEEGVDCPVCGSAEHPRPAASGGTGLISQEEEEQTRLLQDEAENQLQLVIKHRDEAVLERAALQGKGGDGNFEDTRAEARELERELARAIGDQEELERLTTLIDQLSSRHDNQVEARSAHERSLAEEESRLSGLVEQHSAASNRLEKLRGGFTSLHQRVGMLQETVELVEAARDSLEELQRAVEQLSAAEAALRADMAGSAFPEPAEIRGALLGPDELAHFQERIRTAERTAGRLQDELELPGTAVAAEQEREGLPIPGEAAVEEARSAAADAASALEQTILRVGMLEQSMVQLDSHAARIATLQRRIEPLREEHQLAKSLADTARGGGENLYKMSLGTYVLAARLEQVAEAATERLQQMSDGRYSLIHSDSLSGNRKSGLGLNVIDSWTGNRRDTSTLSGGESFMASLALALGLADVVQQESGGLDIETLFVDEGFGSLDEQSLEQVMDALEGLRDGGRVVGLVSHVSELKQRIGAQLQVEKGRNGSSVSFVDQLQRV